MSSVRKICSSLRYTLAPGPSEKAQEAFRSRKRLVTRQLAGTPKGNSLLGPLVVADSVICHGVLGQMSQGSVRASLCKSETLSLQYLRKAGMPLLLATGLLLS
jgi:hypothetical protein